MSLTPYGTPSSGGSAPPRARRSSACRAAARARSPSSVSQACSRGSSASIRPSSAPTTSALETSPLCTPAAIAAADSSHSSATRASRGQQVRVLLDRLERRLGQAPELGGGQLQEWVERGQARGAVGLL